MFKFFRKYNKLILVVGGCVLMVAFLVPQAVTMFAPGANGGTLGEMHGREVSGMEGRSAAYELRLLSSLPFAAAMPTDATGQPIDDEVTWLLLLEDAKAMGLWASDSEVDVALNLIGIDADGLSEMAAARQVQPEFIEKAVRHWLIAEQYRQLVTGTGFAGSGGVYERSTAIAASPAVRRLQAAVPLLQAGMPFGQTQFLTAGTHRISPSLLRHFASENLSSVGGRVLLIQPETQGMDEPTEQQIEALYEQYRDYQPGMGAPMPFGYQIPDRVKLATLAINDQDIRDQVDVGFAQVLEAYRENPQRWAEEGQQAPERPTAEARKQLEQELTDREVEQLRQQVISSIQSAFAEEIRGFERTREGYRNIPADFEPRPLQDIADQVYEQHGVAITVNEIEDWQSLSNLAELPGIGRSMTADFSNVFQGYVASAKPFVDDPQAVPSASRLQVGMGSRPLSGFDEDGNRTTYFFRLLDAQPAHAPESLETVREQVVADARTKAAYEALADQADIWRQRVIDEGFEAVAESSGGELLAPEPFQKVNRSGRGVPRVEGIGISPAFVDAAFALVEGLAPDADVESMSLDQRLAVSPLPSQTALSVFVLDEYNALTRSDYAQAIEQAMPYIVSMSLDGENASDPLSKETLAERAGFELESEIEEPDPDAM